MALVLKFFLKIGQPGLFFHLFSVFSNKQYSFLNNKSMRKNVMSIQYPAPGFERESPPITTRPGLPPNSYLLLIHLFNFDTEHNFQKEPVQPNQLTNFHFH